MTNPYAGRSHDEAVAIRKGKPQAAQEPPGGSAAIAGTEPDREHSSGELSDEGRKIWQTGSGMNGAGKE